MNASHDEPDDARAFAIVLAGALLVVAIAFGLGALLQTPPLATAEIGFWPIAIGVASAMPLVLLLQWFLVTDVPNLARFRDSQIDYFAKIGFAFTPLRMALLAIGAGVSEEMLFRGVLQSWIADGAPLAAAIILPNIVFGLLHARTVLYALIAGVVGVYFGGLYALTGNILAPIISHALYDWVAFRYTREAISRRARITR